MRIAVEYHDKSVINACLRALAAANQDAPKVGLAICLLVREGLRIRSTSLEFI